MKKQRTVNLVVTLTEQEDSLPGTRAWAAKLIESGIVRVGSTKSGNPAAWLTFTEEQRDEFCLSKCSEWLAGWKADFDSCGPMLWDFWPTKECLVDRTDDQLFGVRLRPAAQQLFRHFARKCRTLVKLRVRREDQGARELKVKIHEEQQA